MSTTTLGYQLAKANTQLLSEEMLLKEKLEKECLGYKEVWGHSGMSHSVLLIFFQTQKEYSHIISSNLKQWVV
jgi:hypothetical protein